MRLRELNIREDDVDDKLKAMLDKESQPANDPKKPLVKPSKTDASELGKKVKKLSKPNKAKKVSAVIRKIPIIGGMFKIGMWIGAAEFAGWATEYYNYITGFSTRSDGVKSPCDQGSSYIAAEDPVLDPFLRRPDGDSLAAELSRRLYGFLPGVVGAIATRMTVARTVANMIRIISPAGGVAGVLIAIAAVLVTGAGAYFANKLAQTLPAWGKPFADWLTSKLMRGLASRSAINVMCGVDAQMDRWEEKFTEDTLLENTNTIEDSKRIEQMSKVFTGIINDAKKDFKATDPAAYRKLMKILKRSARTNAKAEEKIKLQAIQQSNVV
mgnify:CR=1 FL=1|jgi:hypothetical protein